MASPIDFPESNKTYGKPENMTEEQCGRLPVAATYVAIPGGLAPGLISCWELSPEEMMEVINTGKIWLTVFGEGHPVVSISGNSPFQKES